MREHLFHAECEAVTSAQHFHVKQAISDRFGIDVNRDLFVVGSAKLGFSISPKKRYRQFHDRSDIDVAIVSHDMYESIWHSVHEYSSSGADWPDRGRFEGYLAWGWIRPDMLPPSPSFPFREEWWDFFIGLQRERVCGPYKVRGAIYHDVRFLERYQAQAVDACRT